MTNSSEESSGGSTEDGGADELGVGDDQLPEDLVPGEDNPLAEGLAPGEQVDDLMEGGKPATESSDGSDGGDDGGDDSGDD